jgi:hypothetical protein
MRDARKGLLILIFCTVGIFATVTLWGLVSRTSDPMGSRPLPPHVAALAGTWEGSWVETAPTELLVESISAADQRAVIHYRWQDYATSSSSPGIVRTRAKLVDGTLVWSYAGLHRFRLSEDGASLMGVRLSSGKEARVIMSRVNEVSSAATPPSLLGTWRGTWQETHPSELKIHAAGAPHAAILYKCDDQPDVVYGDWVRANARIESGRLHWMYAGKHSFEISRDGTTLTGTRHLAGKSARVVMTRVPAQQVTVASRQD